MGRRNEEKLKGVVFDIQRYSIHDGPGIRSTIFLKGCPLKCTWCSNPESQCEYPEIFYRQTRCNKCGKCKDVCPLAAITPTESGIAIDRLSCDRCMKCIEVCPSGALSRTGEFETVEDVVEEAAKDGLFYRNSGGGVTLSGGEPLFQFDFTLAVLKGCKERALNTALDTCGFAKWDVLDSILDYTDLVLFDIKHLDPAKHIAGTGVDNKLILDNLKGTVEKGKRLWIRIPIIPGYNDSEQYIKDLAAFLSKMPVEKVSLLGYHEWSKSKYKALGREYPMKDLSPLEEDDLCYLGDIMKSRVPEVTLGY
ncbi:MAG: glycyl-radical enzyme activating protein [Candidatus Paceibacterota bacterium]|jgi:pyruvate formate lyase activating enzyme